MVSNRFPRHKEAEYPKNCTNNRTNQNSAIPRLTRLPKVVLSNSFAEVRHNTPIKRTTKAIKNVCTRNICRLIKLSRPNSSLH